jgi:YD repeat-containing protein
MGKAMIIFRLILIICILLLTDSIVKAQSPTYPEPVVDQSYIPVSPNAQGIQTYGNEPVALYEGVPAINLPIYEVKCGSISLPISLSYNYNGLFPMQDAGWVGLGWNLNAGGTITRIVEDGVDGSENSGYNYGQYNITDSIYSSPDLNNFLQSAYNNNLGYSGKSYDLAPDIFDAEFCGYSGKYFWYNGKAYMLAYNKELGISWPGISSNITIKTTDGTSYIFGTSSSETTTANNYGGPEYTPVTFTSSWYLTMVISADLKDTISLKYTSCTWQQIPANYQTSYTMSVGTQSDLGTDPVVYAINPSIQTLILQSIACRNTRVSLITDATPRTDVLGTYPKLREIDFIDSLTRNMVKKNLFTYEYFGQTITNPSSYERLALKTFSTLNSQLSTDSLTYVFKYINEFGSFPIKSTNGIDYWGYYNGADANAGILPPPACVFYTTVPSENVGPVGIRTTNFNSCSYGALDTLVYPAGGYTAFQYEQNVFMYNSAPTSGPGIRVKSSTSVTNSPTGGSVQKNYAYLLDDGVSSAGVLSNPPNYNGPSFVSIQNGVNSNYLLFKAANNSGGIGGINPKFYYQEVTESISASNEIHKTSHYFTSYSGMFLNVRQTNQIDYINALGTNLFTPLSSVANTYNCTNDTDFFVVSPYISAENINASQKPPITYTYNYNNSSFLTYWLYPTSQQTTIYDKNGNSITTMTYYNYNLTTRNLASTQNKTSDAQILTQKFKYPEDYTSAVMGTLIGSRVLRPIIEQETWLKQNSSDSLLISGTITAYDPNIFKPITSYSIETTSPIAVLNNQTISGGLYSTLVPDSRYIMHGQLQYDQNSNLNVVTKASDLSVSYIWDYRHSQQIAEVRNATQADIAYTSFEADGTGNWNAFAGVVTTVTAAPYPPTGNAYYNITASAPLSKTGVTSGSTYIISYWSENGVYSISGGNPVTGFITGKTIGGWTYYEHKIQATSSTLTISGTGAIDEVRLYPTFAQMKTYTYTPLVGVSSLCDAENRVTYYQYDGFGRIKVVLDQDHNIIKTIQYHFVNETTE